VSSGNTGLSAGLNASWEYDLWGRIRDGVEGSEPSDVRLARSALANAKAVRASRKQRQSALSRSLEVLLREYPDETLTASVDLPRLAPLAGAGGPAYVLRHRPDLLAAERRMQAAGLQVDAARKALLPSLSFDGGMNLAGSALNNIFDLDRLVADIAGGLRQKRDLSCATQKASQQSCSC